MKKTLCTLALFFYLFTSVNAQQKGINLIKKEDTIFLKENRRIKIKTTDGKIIAGKFKIINDSVISIENRSFLIDSVVAITKESMFSAIIKPVFIAIGAGMIIGGSGLIISDIGKPRGYGDIATAGGILALALGTLLFVLPQTDSKKKKRKWKFEIINQ